MLVSRQQIKAAGESAGTDKILHHAYDRFYPLFFPQLGDGSDILEIGFGGGQSILFWKKLFANSHLYVLDRDVEQSGEGYDVFKCDQSSVADLIRIAERLQDCSFRLVLDDGSHIPEHQITTFNILFSSLLEEGGSYIIEDIETSYWRYYDCYGYKTCYGLGSSRSLIEAFKLVVDFVNREFLAPRERSRLERRLGHLGFDLDVLSTVASVTYGQNCICLTKAQELDRVFSDRIYRFDRNVSPSFFRYCSDRMPAPFRVFIRSFLGM